MFPSFAGPKGRDHETPATWRRAALRGSRACLVHVICSGYAEEEMRERFNSEDMSSFLQKPYTRRALKARLQHLLETTLESSPAR